ncbi:DeoR/GlpR family DNA-binding transcription regulator [uncultured Tateyamaria sp.]|uniref:DeoR/GlpR family DNA-binding transcription regulator n=2 Tax=uncultured Tateyamaria sp. TaxID=455651 RepID=UPI00262FBECB|nr:DeoR/GlpR family DNA-binding transcription regulator [uncultured Tateyamaria sp.]
MEGQGICCYMPEPKDKRKEKARFKKTERRRQILLELKLRPHVRINELAGRFNVSTETVRRDLDALSDDGLIARAHGGASAPAQGHYPGLDERANARIDERENIGRRAAELVRDGETLMIDSGSTTIEMARALAYRGTPCTVITNSIPVAMTLGHGAAQVLLCPGDYLAAESAVIGTETLEFLGRFNVDRCMIGSSGFSEEGLSETVRGFAAVKRMMLQRAASRHLLIDSEKFGRKGLAQVGDLSELQSIVVNTKPTGALLGALVAAGVEINAADETQKSNAAESAAS